MSLLRMRLGHNVLRLPFLIPTFNIIIKPVVPLTAAKYNAIAIKSTKICCGAYSPPLQSRATLRHYSSSTIAGDMEEHCVVPDVIPKAPKESACVEYACGISVRPGMVLTPTQVKDPPCVKWKADAKLFYTLCMTDPDAPSRKDPKFREWHHWLVGNIPGNAIVKGDELSAYIGSGPPKDTGLHRYIFLVYEQKCKVNFDEKRLPNNSGDGRGGFKIAEFAKKYNLCDPIAGNFFQAEYDDYVPTLYKQLGA